MSIANQGALTKMCVEPGASPHTFDVSSEPYRYVSIQGGKIGTITDDVGISGKRSRVSERTRLGPSYVRLRVSMPVSPIDFDAWLPRILGGAELIDVFDVADDLATNGTFGVLVDYGDQTVEYTDCFVDRFILRGRAHAEGRQPRPVEMILDIIGKTAVEGTSFPALTLGIAANDAPYIFEDTASGITLLASTRPINSFVIAIDNHLRPYWRNSLTPTSICPTDRTVLLRTSHPFTTANGVALYDQTNSDWATGTVALTNGTMSTSFAFAILQPPTRGPDIPGREEVEIVLDHQARMLSTTSEVVVTNDPVV